MVVIVHNEAIINAVKKRSVLVCAKIKIRIICRSFSVHLRKTPERSEDFMNL